MFVVESPGRLPLVDAGEVQPERMEEVMKQAPKLRVIPDLRAREDIEVRVERIKAKANVLYWAIFGLKTVGSVTDSDFDGLETQAEIIENELEALASEVHG